MKEYVITLWNHQDLDEFYQEMEMDSHCDCVPDRSVECCNRRKISRNTHYFLTEDEAKALLNDKRVRDVSLTPEEMGFVAEPISRFSDKMNDSYTFGESNWGISTIVNGPTLYINHSDYLAKQNTADKKYNPNGYNYDTGDFAEQQGTLGNFDRHNSISTHEDNVLNYNNGKNVDVVIVDRTIDGDHIEFQKNTSKTLPETVRLPEQIMVSGANCPTGKVLDINYDRYDNNKINHFYSNATGAYDFDGFRLCVETTGSTTFDISLYEGFTKVAEKTVPRPPIMDSGFSFSYDYYCANSSTGFTDLFNRGITEIDFDINKYSGDGSMTNGYYMMRALDTHSGAHQVIPCSSKRNLQSGHAYESFFFVKNRRFNTTYLAPLFGANTRNFIYIAPDIIHMYDPSDFSSLPPTGQFLIAEINASFGPTIITTSTTGITKFTKETGNRLIKRQWFPGYTYSPNPNASHGSHVASIACGNSQGLATESNIYNIDLSYASFAHDWIREFHRSKPINSVTKRKNPTVVNNSWGYSYKPSFGTATSSNNPNGLPCFTGIRSKLNSKYSGVHSPIGDVIESFDLQVSGKINDAEYIKGPLDSTKLVIGGEFTGVSLNGTHYNVQNLFGLDMLNNSMLASPTDSSELFFGLGTEGPVETIYNQVITAGRVEHAGVIFVGGDFTGWIKNNAGEVLPIKNLINFGMSGSDRTGISFNHPTFTGLNGKVKKITTLHDTEYGTKYAFMGDFTGYNSGSEVFNQNHILITDLNYNRTGFSGISTPFTPPIFREFGTFSGSPQLLNGKVNDFYSRDLFNANGGSSPFVMEHEMIIVGRFNDVGGNSCSNICAIDSTGGFVSNFEQNFSGTNGEINAIIPAGAFDLYGQYLALGTFTSGGNSGSSYAARYNLRTGSAKDQIDDFTINGPVTKAQIDKTENGRKLRQVSNTTVHFYGDFSQINGRDINNGLSSNYCSVFGVQYRSNGDRGRYEPILNQKTLSGSGNIEFAIASDNRQNPMVTRNQIISASSPQIRSVRLLGEQVKGHSKSLIHVASTFKHIDIEIAANFGARQSNLTYPLNPDITSVDSDMEDCIKDGIIIINAAGNDNQLLVPSGHPNYAEVLGHVPSPDFSTFEEIPTQLVKFNSVGTPQKFGINVGSFSADINQTGIMNKSKFSNYGPQVHVYAPGENILGAVNSLYIYGYGPDGPLTNTKTNLGSYYEKYNGTSMASPQICGMVALYLQRYPGLTQDKVLRLLQGRSDTSKMVDQNPTTGTSIPLSAINLYESNNNIPVLWNPRFLKKQVNYPERVSPVRDSTGVLYPKIQNKFLS